MFQPWTTQAQQGADPRQGGFAADRTDAAPAAFDSKRAMGYLRDLCKIGPRLSGSEGMKKQQELIQKHFENLGANVTYQRFQAQQKSQAGKVEMANLIVSWHPDRPRRVILCSHYDTRPIADQEPDERRWTEPFVSANDGGSGVALLMELGNHMKDLMPAVGVDFVFFDGEEYIFRPGTDEYFFGSKHFAAEAAKNQRKVRYAAAILLDMIAGKNARYPVERNSMWKAPQLVTEVYRIAQEQKCYRFQPDKFSRFEVLDDHIALNQAGIPAIDLIDFDYAHWHRLTDIPDNCAAEPMEQVARVLSVWLQRVR
jgi:hypothetical protein